MSCGPARASLHCPEKASPDAPARPGASQLPRRLPPSRSTAKESRMSRRTNRRDFLKGAGAAGLGFWVAGEAFCANPTRQRGPNERLNIGVVGCGGRGAGNLAGVGGENIVALCDV